jgi:hypothetical protein
VNETPGLITVEYPPEIFGGDVMTTVEVGKMPGQDTAPVVPEVI